MPEIDRALLPGALLLAVTILPGGAVAQEIRRLPHLEVTIWDRAVSGSAFREEIVQGILDAPPERLFRALTDWEHYDEFMPFVTRSDAAREAGGTVLSFQVLQLPAPMAGRHYRIRARSAATGQGAGRRWRVTWSYVPGSGNVVDHYGSWTLEETAGGKTLVVCRLFTDPGGSIPGWAMHRAMAATLPYVLDGLRQHVRRSRYD